MLSVNTFGVISPLELQEQLVSNDPPIILDVREKFELQICSLPNATHIPLCNLANEWQKLPLDRLIVTVCHHGYRSMQAAIFLKDNNFSNVKNLVGGIHAWAKQIDPTMMVY